MTIAKKYYGWKIREQRTHMTVYLQTVGTISGCPMILITDLVTENRMTASIPCFFRNNSEAYQCAASPRNQHIEG